VRRNYAQVRSRLADAISHELLREDGPWPGIKSKVRPLLHRQGMTRYDEIYQLADAMAAAVLDSDDVRVTAVRKKHKMAG